MFGSAKETDAPSSNDPLTQAFAAMQQQYQEELTYLQNIEQDAQQLETIDQQLAYWEERMGKNPDAGWHVQKLQQQRAGIEQDVQAQEQELEPLDNNADTLCNSLNSLIDGIDNAAEDTSSSTNLVQEDIAQFQTLFQQICQALQLRLQGDLYTNEMNSSAGQNLSPEDFAKLAAQSAQTQMQEAALLNGISSQVGNLMQTYQSDYDAANIEKNSYSIWDDIASYIGAESENTSFDEETMANATDMIGSLVSFLKKMAPELSSNNNVFSNLSQIVKQVIEEIEQILSNSTLSAQAKQAAVLAIVVYLLSLFQMIKQDVDSAKGKNNQQMSQGSIDASDDNLKETSANQKIQDEVERNAAILQKVMMVVQAIMGTLMMLMAPGVGSALLVGLVTIFEELQSANVLNLTQDLGNKIGSQIGAEVLVAVAETVLTAGGGAALDALISKGLASLAQAATREALDATAQLVKQTAEDALEDAGKVGDVKATELVETTLKKMSQAAAEKAVQGVSQQFMKQNFTVLITSMIRKTFSNAVKTAMESAAKEAIENALAQSDLITELAAKGVQDTEDLIDAVATRSANESVASASGKKLATVSEDAARSNLKTALIRAGFSAGYGMISTGLLLDLINKIHDVGDTATDVLQVLFQMVQMLVLMMGTGMMEGATSMEGGGLLSKLPRVVTMANTAPQLVQVAASGGLYETNEQQAEAVEALSLNQSVADLLHSYLEQLQRDASLGTNAMVQNQSQEAQSNMTLAAHLEDGDKEAINVMLAGIG